MRLERHEERCPTCGRFVEANADGYYDLPPGGYQSFDYITAYCNEGCAERKSPPAHYEGEPAYEEWANRPPVPR